MGTGNYKLRSYFAFEWKVPFFANSFSAPTLATTELYDGSSWSIGPELPESRYNHAMVTYQRTKVSVFAGQEVAPGSIPYHLTTYEYDFAVPGSGWVQKENILCPAKSVAYGVIRYMP